MPRRRGLTPSLADRRQFLAAASTSALGAALAGTVAAEEAQEQDQAAASSGAVLDSPPVLQNPTPDGMTVAWAVKTPATGWVEYGTTPDLGHRADAPTLGLLPLDERFLSVRLTGLKPGATVYYRVAAAPIHFASAYNIQRGEAEHSAVYCFTTPSAEADSGSFAVINDTHERTDTLQALTKQLQAEPADVTVWNGDVFNDIHNDDQIVAQVLRPADAAYAAERPVLFTSGNHDVRGVAARQLAQAMTPWPQEGALGRCFAVRQGPLALIGLDTGEDKPDRHPVFAGLASFEPYRLAQRDWLQAALQRPEIANAPFVVVFCHIPLWGLPGHNGGDTLEGYAYYCRHAQQLWHPVLAAAKVQLLVCGHMHQFRYDEPSGERGYGQLVGGGPQLDSATLIRGRAADDKLEVIARRLDQTELGRWQFAPRAMS